MEKYTTHIKAKTRLMDINIEELWKYKDLIYLFVKRNIVTKYKQTILGPLWLILNPVMTVSLYTLVFGNIAQMSTDGCPQFAFYLTSNALWSYFSLCLTQTSTTFTANAAVFGKVYFPRLTMPIATVVTGMLDLIVQLGLLVITLIIYMMTGIHLKIGVSLLLVPVLIIQIALLGLGCGIIVSALTTKYRDLAILVTFGAQLWMYVSPVVYPIAQIPAKYLGWYMLNPIAPIMTIWRYAFLGAGEPVYSFWAISWIETFVVLIVGILLFNKVEKTFMDTV